MTPSPPARSSAEKVNGKPPARAAFCIQNAAVAAFRMRRRRGAVRSAASAAPRAISAERKASVEAFTTPLSFPHGKESAVDGRKKGWQRGSFESPPLQTPLKRPRRGLRPPSLDFPRGLVCAEFVFRLSKRATDASLIDRRGSRNTLRLFRMYLAWKSVCARYAMQPLQEERPFDFHTSNIQWAQIKRLVLCIVRLGNPILRPPEGRSLRDALSVNGTQNQNAFSARQRYLASSGLFFHIFSAKTEKIWPAERR